MITVAGLRVHRAFDGDFRLHCQEVLIPEWDVYIVYTIESKGL